MTKNKIRFNIIDFMIIIAVIGCVVGVALRYNVMDRIGLSSTTNVVEIDFEIFSIRPTSFDAMVKGEKLARAYLQDAQEDSDISGANDVGAGKPDEEEQNEADEMAAYINKKKGV